MVAAYAKNVEHTINVDIKEKPQTKTNAEHVTDQKPLNAHSKDSAKKDNNKD